MKATLPAKLPVMGSTLTSSKYKQKSNQVFSSSSSWNAPRLNQVQMVHQEHQRLSVNLRPSFILLPALLG